MVPSTTTTTKKKQEKKHHIVTRRPEQMTTSRFYPPEGEKNKESKRKTLEKTTGTAGVTKALLPKVSLLLANPHHLPRPLLKPNLSIQPTSLSMSPLL